MILPLGFGIAFQLPLVMLFLNRIGLFEVESYMAKWRLAVLVIFVVAMFLTPADPISMMLLAAPPDDPLLWRNWTLQVDASYEKPLQRGL